MSNSCLGCKYLYSMDVGYSNYTVLNTLICCAKDNNPLLAEDGQEPHGWNKSNDNWDQTNNSRCSLYEYGDMVALDVDQEVGPADCTDDEESIVAICVHANRGRNGGNYV